jgi:hypothetical protein
VPVCFWHRQRLAEAMSLVVSMMMLMMLSSVLMSVLTEGVMESWSTPHLGKSSAPFRFSCRARVTHTQFVLTHIELL